MSPKGAANVNLPNCTLIWISQIVARLTISVLDESERVSKALDDNRPGFLSASHQMKVCVSSKTLMHPHRAKIHQVATHQNHHSSNDRDVGRGYADRWA